MSESANAISNDKKYSFNNSEIQEIIHQYGMHGLNKYEAESNIKYADEHYTISNVVNNINEILDTDHVLHFRGMDNMKELYELFDNKKGVTGAKTTTRWLELKNILFTYDIYNSDNDYNFAFYKHIDVYKRIILIKLDKLININIEEADKLIMKSYNRRIIAFLDYMQNLHSGKNTVTRIKEIAFGHSNKDIFKKITPPRSENYIVIPKDSIHAVRHSLGTLVVNVTNSNDTSVLKDVPKIALSSIINPFKKNTKVAIYN